MIEILVMEYGLEIGGKEAFMTSKVLKANDMNGIFYQFYQLNRSLRYCNGWYWTFNDENLEKQFQEWRQKNETIEMYYGGNVYD